MHDYNTNTNEISAVIGQAISLTTKRKKTPQSNFWLKHSKSGRISQKYGLLR